MKMLEHQQQLDQCSIDFTKLTHEINSHTDSVSHSWFTYFLCFAKKIASLQQEADNLHLLFCRLKRQRAAPQTTRSNAKQSKAKPRRLSR
jgi:hypothetical protein